MSSESQLFPILRLPLLALEEILLNAGLIELYNLATLSGRLWAFLKNHFARNSNRFNLQIIIRLPEYFLVTNFRGLSLQVRYAQNYHETFKQGMLDCQELFNFPPVHLHLSRAPDNIVLEFLECLKKPNFKRDIIVFLDTYSGAITENIVNACRSFPRFLIKGRTPMRIQHSKCKPFTFKNLTLNITYADWVSIEHITDLFMDCKSLRLQNCKLGAVEFAIFLQKWTQNSSMEEAVFNCNAFTFQKVFRNFTFSPPAVMIEEVKLKGKTIKAQEGACYMLQQQSGKRAIVYFSTVSKLTLTTAFEL